MTTAQNNVPTLVSSISETPTATGFVPMMRDPAKFPLSEHREKLEGPIGVGSRFANRSTTGGSAASPHTPVIHRTVPALVTTPAPKPPTIEEIMSKLPEEMRAAYAIPGRHDIVAAMLAVVTYTEDDFLHAIDNTPYQIVYLAKIDGTYMVHMRRMFGTALRMQVDSVAELPGYKPRFRLGEGTDHLSLLAGELKKKNLTVKDLYTVLDAAKVDSKEFFTNLGVENVDALVSKAKPKVDIGLDLNKYFPEGKRPPIHLLHQIVSLFKEVCKRGNTQLEAHTQIVWVPEKDQVPGHYEVRVPSQRVSGASVSYDHDGYDPATELCVMDIHSH